MKYFIDKTVFFNGNSDALGFYSFALNDIFVFGEGVPYKSGEKYRGY